MEVRPARLACVLALLGALSHAHAAEPLAAPGFRPTPPGVHALTGGTVVARPGSPPAKATLVIRDGRIAAVGPDVAVPPDARVWDCTGLTVYAGLIEPHLASGNPGPPVSNQGGTGTDAGALQGGPEPRFFGVRGDERDPGQPGPGSALADVTPEFHVAAAFSPDPKLLESLRETGFTAANFVPSRGIIRGQSALAALSDRSPNQALLRVDTAQHVAFVTASQGYPSSLMGVVAVVRQTWLDAAWQARDLAHWTSHPLTRPRPQHHAALAALQPTLASNAPQPVVVEPGSILMLDRAQRLARELGFRPVLLASGQEWRRPDLLARVDAPLIVPLVQPAAPRLTDDADWDEIPLDLLRQWDWAPENPAVIRRAGRELALTTHGLSDRKEFRKNLRAAIDRGLSEDDALAAMTTVPARLCGIADQLGTVEAGKLAFLTVVAGSYFEPSSRIHAVWVDGQPFEMPADPRATRATNPPVARTPRPRVAREPLAHRGILSNPPALLVRNAVLWTCGPGGTRTNAALFVRDGRIVSAGPEPAVLPPGTLVVDGTGLHVSPGIIDCHSHSMILGAVNEGTLPDSAMCRIGDVVNSESDNLHQQLAGGVTAVNLLHGSANPIGGQNCVIKLRDGAGPEELKFAAAPQGIKFALGENVKQSGSATPTSRYPQTRMGVGTFYVNRFTAARQYAAAHADWAAGRRDTPPPRRDLDLEALAEILDGSRLVHCHSYRQDEVLAFLRTMESFGVRVATLQHILEGYKVADEIARHGAGASAFADWWAYKYEVVDAIPYAGSILHQRGVLVSFNSDSSDHARRLNFEAAKAVKYGGTPEAEALKFVTLNPAKQLHVDRRVGSLEAGKDADFVLWSGPPLDSSTVCLQTWVDGRLYFDRARETARSMALRTERAELVAKARQPAPGPETPPGDRPPAANRAQFFERALEQARQFGVVECQDCRLDVRH